MFQEPGVPSRAALSSGYASPPGKPHRRSPWGRRALLVACCGRFGRTAGRTPPTAWEFPVTSATFTRPSRTVSRRQVRIAAAAAGLVGALVLTACSDGGDSKDDSSSSPSSASSTATADTGGGTGGPTSTSDDLQGSWLATTGGKAVALVITGKQAGLFSTGGT